MSHDHALVIKVVPNIFPVLTEKKVYHAPLDMKKIGNPKPYVHSVR